MKKIIISAAIIAAAILALCMGIAFGGSRVKEETMNEKESSSSVEECVSKAKEKEESKKIPNANDDSTKSIESKNDKKSSKNTDASSDVNESNENKNYEKNPVSSTESGKNPNVVSNDNSKISTEIDSKSETQTSKIEESKSPSTPIYKTITHPAEFEQRWIVDKQPYSEEVPVYETKTIEVCNTCGADITNSDISEHIYNHMINDEDNGGYRTEYIDVQVGTKTVTHPEEGHYEQVKVKDEYTETIIVGYQ